MKTKSKRFKQGDILEIPLIPYLNLYSYAMYIDCGKIIGNFNHINPFRWIVYDYFSKSRIQNLDAIDFSNLLCNPLYMFWDTSLSGLGDWEVVGNCGIQADYCIPKYIRRLNHIDHNISPKKYSELSWSAFLDTESDLRLINNWLSLPWENVKHLERSGSTSLNALPFRIVLEYFKMIDFAYDTSGLNTMEQLIYQSCCDIPPYKDIPLEYRQRPVPKDVDLPWTNPQKIFFIN